MFVHVNCVAASLLSAGLLLFVLPSFFPVSWIMLTDRLLTSRTGLLVLAVLSRCVAPTGKRGSHPPTSVALAGARAPTGGSGACPHTHTHTHTPTHTHTHTYPHLPTHLPTPTHTHNTHTHTYPHLPTPIHTPTHTHNTPIHTPTHTHTHTYPHPLPTLWRCQGAWAGLGRALHVGSL
jgi:hypothetical protein